MLHKYIHFTSKEKATFRYHMIYSILEGIIFGILALNEFVFIKSLKGSNIQLGILFQLTVVVFIFLIFFNVFIRRTENKQRLLRKTAIITRLPLFLIFFFPKDQMSYITNPYLHYFFLLLFLLFYFESPITYPVANLLLKKNYQPDNFGTFYGFSTTINKLIALIVTFAYGVLLDFDNYAFTYILPMTAILGVISIFTLSKIEYSNKIKPAKNNSFLNSVGESIQNMIHVIKNNSAFRHFEIGFMFYGFAYMITVAVITIFFQEVLSLNYTSVAFYKNTFNIIAIAFIPFLGKIIGNIDPRKFAAFSFLSMICAIFFIALTEYFPINFSFFQIKIYYILLIYVIFYGVFIGSMALVWRIGSAYFCKSDETDLYQSIHLSATGIRGLIAPLLGIVIYEIIGFTYTFAIAILSLILAISILYWSLKNIPLNHK